MNNSSCQFAIPSHFRLVPALCVGLSAPAFAICADNQETVFSCDAGSKQVELCLTPKDQMLTYRFGPEGRPELELARDFSEILMRPWNGIGRNIWDQVTLWSGDFGYTVHWSYDKIAQEVSGGVIVELHQKTLAELTCDAAEEGGALFELETLSFAMQEAGYCRSDPSEPLSFGTCQ